MLNFIANEVTLTHINVHSSLYADVNGFLNPSMIAGENCRPDLLFQIQPKCLYTVLELTVGFECNLNNNAVCKKEKYLNLIKEMSRNYRCVKFVKISPCQLPWRFLRWMLHVLRHDEIGIDKKQQLCIIKKIIYIAIRATYYIFCCRNRNWDSPDLMQFWYFLFFFLSFFSFVFCWFCFVFFLNKPISSSFCKLPIRSKIYNCTFKNTNKVSL